MYRLKSLSSTNSGIPKVRLYLGIVFSCPLSGSWDTERNNQRAAQNNYYIEPNFGVSGFVLPKLCYLYLIKKIVIYLHLNHQHRQLHGHSHLGLKFALLGSIWEDKGIGILHLSSFPVWKVQNEYTRTLCRYRTTIIIILEKFYSCKYYIKFEYLIK